MFDAFVPPLAREKSSILCCAEHKWGPREAMEHRPGPVFVLLWIPPKNTHKSTHQRHPEKTGFPLKGEQWLSPSQGRMSPHTVMQMVVQPHTLPVPGPDHRHLTGYGRESLGKGLLSTWSSVHSPGLLCVFS